MGTETGSSPSSVEMANSVSSGLVKAIETPDINLCMHTYTNPCTCAHTNTNIYHMGIHIQKKERKAIQACNFSTQEAKARGLKLAEALRPSLNERKTLLLVDLGDCILKSIYKQLAQRGEEKLFAYPNLATKIQLAHGVQNLTKWTDLAQLSSPCIHRERH